MSDLSVNLRAAHPPLPTPWRRWGARAAVAAAAVAGLWISATMYLTGEAVFAGLTLLLWALGLYCFTSTRAYVFRYLFPGLAGVGVFIIFPLLYTGAIAFSNMSARNLLGLERVQEYLLDQRDIADGRKYRFSLIQAADGVQVAVRIDARDYATAPFDPANPPATVALRPTRAAPGPALPMRAVIAHRRALGALEYTLPEGTVLRLAGLRNLAASTPRYQRAPDGLTLIDQRDSSLWRPDFETGFYRNDAGEALTPGFRVGVGWANFVRVFTDPGIQGPFWQIFAWTVAFAGLTVVFTFALGFGLACVLEWDAIGFRSGYRVLLILPYAVPSFISILVFKGLFNQEFGEINLILQGLFGVKPSWFTDPLAAKAMLLLVNTWLGFPYMLILGTGLLQAVPRDLYEASAVEGAGPLGNFFRITLPFVIKPFTPLLIASFAFNFNNFVLIALLTGGRPDILGASTPAGTTDLLVSYTYRIAFQDSGQDFGLAAAISVVIFLITAGLSLINIGLARRGDAEGR